MASKRALVSGRPDTDHAKACIGFERNSPTKIHSEPVTPNLLDGVSPYSFANEPIFVCVDLERAACKDPPILTEIGLTILDTRDLGPRSKPLHTTGTPPLVRGQAWFKFFKTTHFRIKEQLPHENCWYAHCRHQERKFAFGRSRILAIQDVKRTLEDWYKNVERRQLATGEEKRYVIVVTFCSRLEETELHIQEVGWFQKVSEAWDIQKMRFAQDIASNLGKQLPSLLDLVIHLGIASADDGERLLHNAGNDSAFELQCLIAGLLVNTEEQPLLGLSPLKCLPPAWKEHHIASNEAPKYQTGGTSPK